jgi:hypothetical protein
VARGSVHNAGAIARTKKMFRRAFESQVRGEGFTFVEVLTMCPTGWFIPTAEGPDYMNETLGEVHIMGELKVGGVVTSTEELHAENVRDGGAQALANERTTRAAAGAGRSPSSEGLSETTWTSRIPPRPRRSELSSGLGSTST